MASREQYQPSDTAYQQPKAPAHLVIPSVSSLAFDNDTIELSTRPDAREVARYLIQLAAAEDEPEYLTHMRLQKLMYYAQGWSLALRDRPLFDERIEAWAHGPVVKDVYPHFANFGDQPIPPSSVGKATKLSEEDKEFISAVWNSYKAHSANSLRNMTHMEEPWREARKGFAPADKCTVEITKDALAQFFVRASKREQAKG